MNLDGNGYAALGLLLREAETALRPYARPSGEVVFDAPAHIVTARKPA